VAGKVEERFNGGIMHEPMLFIFGDRATFQADGIEIPVKEVAITTARSWFKKNLRFVDPESNVRYQVELKQGSSELTGIFKSDKKLLGANDTSAAVGYAPMTKTERIVLDTEKYLNSKSFKKDFPESGEDIKVMAYRSNNNIQLTVSMGFVDRFIKNEKDYFKKKQIVSEAIDQFANENSNFENIDVNLNTLDIKGKGAEGVYLTVLGTSADGADSGQVGRGNKVNGVISLNRPLGSEAAAGKNPISHVGKIYNVLTHKIANQIYNQVAGLNEVYIWLLSQIGRPIDQPAIAAAQVVIEGNIPIKSIQKEINEVVNSELENIDKFCEDLAAGRIPIC
jgi:S-adenosylmethionine synthetase